MDGSEDGESDIQDTSVSERWEKEWCLGGRVVVHTVHDIYIRRITDSHRVSSVVYFE